MSSRIVLLTVLEVTLARILEYSATSGICYSRQRPNLTCNNADVSLKGDAGTS